MTPQAIAIKSRFIEWYFPVVRGKQKRPARLAPPEEWRQVYEAFARLATARD